MSKKTRKLQMSKQNEQKEREKNTVRPAGLKTLPGGASASP
jgi:hypothetical protein